jgi:hypothetical protein
MKQLQFSGQNKEGGEIKYLEEIGTKTKKPNEDYIDAPFEIIDNKKETKIDIEEEEENTMDKIEITELEKYEEIQKSLVKQINSDNVLPIVVDLKYPSGNSVITTPIIFTIRNDFWRSKVRFIMNNVYKDKFIVKDDDNIHIPPTITIVLYNAEKQAVEIVVIMPMKITNYLSNDETFNEILNKICKKDGNYISDSCIKLICKSFGISLRTYYILIEPLLIGKNIPPTSSNERNIIADYLRIKPVLSFDVDSQRISIDTYKRGIIKVNF